MTTQQKLYNNILKSLCMPAVLVHKQRNYARVGAKTDRKDKKSKKNQIKMRAKWNVLRCEKYTHINYINCSACQSKPHTHTYTLSCAHVCMYACICANSNIIPYYWEDMQQHVPIYIHIRMYFYMYIRELYRVTVALGAQSVKSCSACQCCT